jgi:hypothetical protein
MEPRLRRRGGRGLRLALAEVGPSAMEPRYKRHGDDKMPKVTLEDGMPQWSRGKCAAETFAPEMTP